MAASVSAWLKPGGWALDAEEHDAALAVGNDLNVSSLELEPQQQDFPSLATAAASKTSKKKKKPQPVSLAEFTSGKPVSYGAGRRALSSAALTPDELLALPTGPRERSAEELERSSSRGFGYSYGSRDRTNGEETNPDRWGASRVSDEPRRGGFGGFNRDLEPSRADEIDDWGASKKSSVPERRERVGGGKGPLFESHSRADESDNWTSTKSAAPPRAAGGGGGFVGSRDRMSGFDMLNKDESTGGRADSDTWGRKKDFTTADAWKKEEDVSNGPRRRLVLQPRSLPLSNGDNIKPVQGETHIVSPEKKSRASNPFGAARPREEVLAEKGQDWKEIEEKLEFTKIRDAQCESVSVSKKGFGTSNGSTDSENSWRKPLTTETSPRNDKAENTVPEN
ncbi:eukaryotic translation initiation factor 4B3-like [Zingiber officinale]|uniref:eukaryotic translation initiation factor 4B3-like n=1 Tax=Zingiber officinale TaxID=94328 RepID=UPI001C4D48A4|nr:eukaryotic translation initiation factor 4B3-like [Zingiber officinale]